MVATFDTHLSRVHKHSDLQDQYRMYIRGRLYCPSKPHPSTSPFSHGSEILVLDFAGPAFTIHINSGLYLLFSQSSSIYCSKG